MAENTHHKKLLLLAGVSILASASLLSASSSYAASCSCRGSQSRSVTCLDHKGDTTSDVYCQDSRVGPRPSSSQSCTATCYYYSGGGDGGDGQQGSHDTNGDGLTDTPGMSNNSSNNSTGSIGNMSDGGGSGSGGGGGGGSVLCGYFFTRGLVSRRAYVGDQLYARHKANDEAKRGYYIWAVPLTKYLNNNKGGLVEKIIQPLIISWSKEMAHRMGFYKKGTVIGKAMMLTFYPFCHVLGHFVQDTDCLQLKSERLARKLAPVDLPNTKNQQFTMVWQKANPGTNWFRQNLVSI